MTDAILDSDDFLDGEEEPLAEPAPMTGTGPGVMFAGRYRIDTTTPLPQLSNPHAQAFAAEDTHDPALELYGLVLDPAIPYRNDAMLNVRSVPFDGCLKPVRWGQVDWPAARATRTVVVLPRPIGDPLMKSMQDQFRFWTSNEIVRNLLAPMIEFLVRLGEQRLTHRNIRPTNLFHRPNDAMVVSGEFFCAPPGFNQPAVFEPIERAMCLPAGRGSGEMADDLFALGVTMLMLAVGRNPVAGIDDATLMRRRLELGSYNAILAGAKLPTDLAPVIRSLLRDDVHERWSIADLAHWAHSGRVNPAQPVAAAHADRPFELAGVRGTTTREVANILATNWTAALEAVKGEAVERWVDRSLKDRELAKDIVACRSSAGGGPRLVSDDLLLARTIVTLDPSGPIRFRDLRVMPDGIGAVTCAVVGSEALATAYRDMMTNRLVAFWHEKQARPRAWMLASDDIASRLNIYLSQNSPGYGVERCLYEAHVGMTCRSGLLGGRTTTQPRELLELLDLLADKGGTIVDRHVAAFLAARVAGNIDKDLNDLAVAGNETQVQLSQLRMLAFVQSKNGPPALRNLYALYLDRLEPMIDEYRNVALRKRIRREVERLAPRGVLTDLLRLLDSGRDRRWDQRGFGQARKRFRALETSILEMEASEGAIPRKAQRLGRQLAANLASVIGALVVALLVVTRLG